MSNSIYGFQQVSDMENIIEKQLLLVLELEKESLEKENFSFNCLKYVNNLKLNLLDLSGRLKVLKNMFEFEIIEKDFKRKNKKEKREKENL